MMKINITMNCPFCGKGHVVRNVGLEDYYNWLDGVSAQKAFPYLNATEREQLISDICPECQKEFFDE